jgi:hexokinase
LSKWTKGFTASGVEGKDVVILLHEAFKRKGLGVDIKAVVNDTVGTLMSHAYSEPETLIGVILGTGTNAAYVEKAANVPKWKSDTGEIIINTEWGNFGAKGELPMTDFDIALDKNSANPGNQRFEKMISGMYLGEITRLVLIDLAKRGVIFKGQSFINLPSFETSKMSIVERQCKFT